MKISLLLPTRNRINNLKRLFASIIDTAYDLSNIEISFKVDSDDLRTIDFLHDWNNVKINSRLCITDRCGNRGEHWNDAWRNATGELLMMTCDDYIFRTKDWDKIIIDKFNEFPDKILFVYADDGYQHGNCGVNAVIHKNWTDIAGYYASMNFKSFFHDAWNDDIAKRLNRRIYMPIIYIEHMHYMAHKAVRDITYAEAEENRKGVDELSIYRSTINERQELANKLQEFINNYGK